MKRIVQIACLLWANTGIGLAAPSTLKVVAGDLKQGNDLQAEALSPAEELASFEVPGGFSVELVSSEEQGTVKPISIAFDDAGCLWTQTAKDYPGDKNDALFKSGGRDRILVFDEAWKPGPHRARVFAKDLAMPVSVLPHDHGVYVIHGPDILFLEDRDGDGISDHRTTLISGFGIQDTHTTIHQLTRTPGNWITLSQGCNSFGTATTSDGVKVPFDRARIGRFHPDGTGLETIATGMNNIWCWAISQEGRTYIHEANDFGYSQVPLERDTTYPSFINTLRYPDSIKHPPTAEGLALGGTGFSGIAISENCPGGFPEKWNNMHFVANPITGSINTVSFTIDSNGVHHFEKQADLLTSGDPMFRPVAIEFGPDGCLYIIDWYNRIISHNEVGIDHPARDKVSGRIWRIRHQSQKSNAVSNVETSATTELIGHLKSGNTWRMRAAWHQIGKRKAVELVPNLTSLILDKRTSDGVRVHALWCLESLGNFDEQVWQALLASSNENVRHEAVRSLSTLQPEIDLAFSLLGALGNEKSYYVANEIVRFFRDTPQALASKHLDLVLSFRTSKETLPTDKVEGWGGPYLALGGAYEKAFLNLLVDKVESRDMAPAPAADESRWNSDLAENPKHPADEQKQIDSRIQQLATAFQNAHGDPAQGRLDYQARCAICHSTDDEHKGFAPALNGGPGRTPEALLTAILDPNASAEAVFNVYRVVKTDGTILEGFRSNLTNTQITLTFMGGGTLEIPINEIEKAGYIKGKSMMLEGLADGMTEQEIINLLAYLRSIK